MADAAAQVNVLGVGGAAAVGAGPEGVVIEEPEGGGVDEVANFAIMRVRYASLRHAILHHNTLRVALMGTPYLRDFQNFVRGTGVRKFNELLKKQASTLTNNPRQLARLFVIVHYGTETAQLPLFLSLQQANSVDEVLNVGAHGTGDFAESVQKDARYLYNIIVPGKRSGSSESIANVRSVVAGSVKEWELLRSKIKQDPSVLLKIEMEGGRLADIPSGFNDEFARQANLYSDRNRFLIAEGDCKPVVPSPKGAFWVVIDPDFLEEGQFKKIMSHVLDRGGVQFLTVFADDRADLVRKGFWPTVECNSKKAWIASLNQAIVHEMVVKMPIVTGHKRSTSCFQTNEGFCLQEGSHRYTTMYTIDVQQCTFNFKMRNLRYPMIIDEPGAQNEGLVMPSLNKFLGQLRTKKLDAKLESRSEQQAYVGNIVSQHDLMQLPLKPKRRPMYDALDYLEVNDNDGDVVEPDFVDCVEDVYDVLIDPFATGELEEQFASLTGEQEDDEQPGAVVKLESTLEEQFVKQKAAQEKLKIAKDLIQPEPKVESQVCISRTPRKTPIRFSPRG